MHLESEIYDDNDNLITVHGYLIVGQQGIRDCYGQMETPDDLPEVEFTEAYDHDDNEIDLTEVQKDEAIDALWEEARA